MMTGTTIAAVAAQTSLEIVCTCAHGADHGSCPMHRTRTDPTRCQLTGTQGDLAGALTSLLAAVALPAASDLVSVDARSPGVIRYAPPSRANWIVPPEPPPPRI
jgi:hypothetical protein